MLIEAANQNKPCDSEVTVNQTKSVYNTLNNANGLSSGSVKLRSKTRSLMSTEARRMLYENIMPPKESIVRVITG